MGFPLNNPIDMRQVASPASPAAGTSSLYVKTDDRLYLESSTGLEPSLMAFATQTIASSATPTPTGYAHRNLMVITAQAAAAVFAAPSGTVVEGNSLIIRIKDNATARGLTWNAIYRGIDTTNVPLPSTTTISKWLYLGFSYNATDTKWDLVALLQQT